MSGHSKWSSIKHKKGAVDANRNHSPRKSPGAGEVEAVGIEPTSLSAQNDGNSRDFSVEGHVVIAACNGKGQPIKGCKCAFCRR